MRRLFTAASIIAAMCFAMSAAAAPPPGRNGGFNFRFGAFFPTADSDFWTTNEAAFTLDDSDFVGPIGGVGYNAAITNYFEFDANADFYTSMVRSSDRYYYDLDGYPIFHDSRLLTFPLSFGVRVLPAGRYARRGPEGAHYVRRPVPYIGAGVGTTYWQYEEEGDFVASDLSIVYDRFVASGLAFQWYAMIGIEFPVAPEWNITLEVRQTWADATPGGSFTYINPGTLDLGGTSVFLGGSLRF
jgi:opacity protein-like surface antigen